MASEEYRLGYEDGKEEGRQQGLDDGYQEGYEAEQLAHRLYVESIVLDLEESLASAGDIIKAILINHHGKEYGKVKNLINLTPKYVRGIENKFDVNRLFEHME